MALVVTGTAGFIGFHLAKSLLDDGYEVVGIDNFNDYYDVRLKQDRDAILKSYAGYTGQEMDLVEFDKLKGVIKDAAPEAVCNLAAQAGVRHSLTNPFVYVKSNLEGFLNILEICRHMDPQPRLVYASSSSVYGGNTELPFSEADRVDTPISLYAATKKSDELMAHAYSHLFGLQTVGLRFFTVYGPWGRPDMAMWLFAKAMFAGETIKVFNHGNMQRDFTYVDDIVNGVRGAMFSSDLNPYEIFNLGNHRSENLMDMINLLAETLGIEPKMELLPMQPGDVPATYADVSKAQAKLGFEPSTPISEGIPKFIAWYREYHGL